MRAQGIVGACAVFFANAASAQEWDWQITPYLWGSGIVGDVGLGPVQREVDVDFADLANALAGAALVRAEVTRGDHTLFGDLVWMSVEPEDEIATVGGVAEMNLDSTILELGYARTPATLGFELGIRYWDMELELDPALLASTERGDDWIDGFVGLRHLNELGEHWTLTSRLNVGAGGSDFSYGMQFDFARGFESGNALVTGIKVLDIDYDDETAGGIAVRLDTTFVGATIGYRFD